MSALDQAFIKAYEKKAEPKPQATPPSHAAVPPATVPRIRRVIPTAPPRDDAIDEVYADGAWYRIDRPVDQEIPLSANGDTGLPDEPVAAEPTVVVPVGKREAADVARVPSDETAPSLATSDPDGQRPNVPEPVSNPILSPEEIAQLMSVDMTPVVVLPDYEHVNLTNLAPQVEMAAEPDAEQATENLASTRSKSGEKLPVPAAPAPAAPAPASPPESPPTGSTANDRGLDSRKATPRAVDAGKQSAAPTAQDIPTYPRPDKAPDQQNQPAPEPARPDSRPSETTPLDLKPIAEIAPSATPAVTPSTPKSPTAEPQQAFQPEWEVDRFAWPRMCETLYRNQQQYFTEAGRRLKAASGDGLNVLAITSPRRGDGKTTLALCLARCAVEAGVRVALVDADFAHPQLQSLLGMNETCSWHDALENNLPLNECAIVSRDDELVVFPLGRAARAVNVPAQCDAIARHIQEIAERFDLVLVDLGAMDAHAPELCDAAATHSTQAVIVVRDLRHEDDGLDDTVARIHASGIEAVGIAENFGANQVSQKRSA